MLWAMIELSLPLVCVKIILEVEDPSKLPRHLFSPLRGILGANLKRISCVARRYSQCLECPLNQHCAYGYIFETPRPEDADRLRLYPYLPHPFTITPPYPTPQEQTIALGLTLVGRAIQYFPHFILSIGSAGEKGIGRYRAPFRILDVVDCTNSSSLYNPSTKALSPPELISTFSTRECHKLSLTFHTPLSLKFQGKLAEPQGFSFHILLRNLLRRLSALSYFHAGKELDLDFKGLIAMAQKIETVDQDLRFVRIKRYSARTKREMPLQGLVGRVSFEGNLTPFTPLLEAGSLVHVGKNTSFGLGHYSLD